MDLIYVIGRLTIGCFPRTGGDGPHTKGKFRGKLRFPPHRRGWTAIWMPLVLRPPVSPAQAGMDRADARSRRKSSRFPRTGGDGPLKKAGHRCLLSFPPHRRGWTSTSRSPSEERRVSPAQAGMDRWNGRPTTPPLSFPRTGGDGPLERQANDTTIEFPPHRRGWTLTMAYPLGCHDVSPAQAGMDPR